MLVTTDSAPGFTLATGQPTVSDDLSKEKRFQIPQVLLGHGVKSMANVLIRAGDCAFGVLEADNNKLRKFTERDTELLQGFANILALVIAQAKLAAENRALSEKKELLLRELAHRTKNNNQMLMSIVSLQRMKTTSKNVQEALEDVDNRIRLLSSVDEMLLLDEEKDSVDAASFVSAVAGRVFAAMSDEDGNARLVLELLDGALSRRQLQALAIIINEFITNSCKHALHDGGRLSVSLRFDAEASILELADDGPGFSDDAATGLGMQIIEATARQVGATTTWSTDRGTRLAVSIPCVSDAWTASRG